MANTFEKIATVTVGSGGATSIDFTSIPQTFTDLMLKGSIRTDRGTFGVDETLLQFNGDTTSGNYSHRFLRGNGSSADSSFANSSYPWGPGGNGSVNTANTFGNGENYIPNYRGSQPKTFTTYIGAEGNSATNVYLILDEAIWTSTAAITSIKILHQGTAFAQHSSVTLYGITRA
jgi:hypothetical protein